MLLLYLLIRLYESAFQIQKTNFHVCVRVIGVLRLHDITERRPCYNPPNVLFRSSLVPLP